MLDIWIADALVLTAVVGMPISTILRMRPRLLPGEGLTFPDWQIAEEKYRRRYIFRLVCFRILPAILAIYFGYRLFTWPPDVRADGPDIPTFYRALFAAFVFAMVVSSVLRIRQERAFVKEHPQFADSVLPVRPRVMAIVPILLSFGCIIASMSFHDLTLVTTLFLLGLVGIIVSRKLQVRSITRSRHELSWDEPLGARIAEVLQQFGYTPKKLILMPSMVTNAYALVDGSVLVTSALRTLVSKDEVAGVVAHELSHSRDGEGKKLQRVRLALTLPFLLLQIPFLVLFLGTSAEPFLPPFLSFAIVSVLLIPAMLFGRYSRRLEFKCDRDAAKVGLGLSLASCLTKITAFMGNPRRWIGLDKYILTHPSLDERVAALEKAHAMFLQRQEG
jgi:Zn-dependent protease with chaperone function